MDAEYLKKNVESALTEALTSMAVSSPDDKIEYLGRYLLQYVKRRQEKKVFNEEWKVSEEAGKIAAQEEDALEVKARQKAETDQIYFTQLPAFIRSFETSSSSKQDAMNKVTKFVKEYLNIPACYIAIKRVVGETETLHYFSANPGQEHVIGNKIVKITEEGDETPQRQGISFEAFKLPEVPEVEEEEVPEGEEPPPPRAPPKPVPLIVENAMREKRCKFFGIPKLGAYAAVPISLQSIDHDAGCSVAPPPEVAEGEDGAPAPAPAEDASPYAPNKLPLELIIAMDTIGDYRTFKKRDIEVVEEIGISLVRVLENIEADLYKKQVLFLESHKEAAPKIAALTAPAADAEAAAIAQVGVEMTPDPALDPPPEPDHEAFRPYREADAVLKVWIGILGSDDFVAAFAELHAHVLPVVPLVSNLIYIVGLFCGMQSSVFKDVCGDISWEIISTTCLPEVHKKVLDFKPSLIKTVPREASLENIKAYCEANALLDPAAYPATLPTLAPLCIWLQKAIAAREAAMVYFKDAKEKVIETIL